MNQKGTRRNRNLCKVETECISHNSDFDNKQEIENEKGLFNIESTIMALQLS